MSPAIAMQSVSHGHRRCRFITFHVSRRSREIYCGHARLCVLISLNGPSVAVASVCVCVCL